MLILIPRRPSPDLAYWPGRRWLAGLDALAWPAAVVWVVCSVPLSTGLFGPVVQVLAVLAGAARLHRALWINHRYRFTTSRWAGGVIVLVAAGILLKIFL